MSKTGIRVLQVATGVLLGLLTVLLLFPLLDVERPADDPHLLPAPYPAPTARLTDHRGREAPLPGEFDGLTVVFFGYTHCPDVCPVTMANLAAVRDRLEPELAERFRAVLVTVDPVRDTPERLREYVGRFDTSFVGMTGSEGEIRAAAGAWGAWAERAAEPAAAGTDTTANDGPAAATGDTAAAGGGRAGAGPDPHAAHGAPPGSPAGDGYLVDHTARSFVVDGRGRIVATFPPSTPPEAMLPTVRHLLEDEG